MGGYFVLSSGGRMYEAKTVILAMGAKATNPIPGEQQLLGSGVSYCATCDGMVYEGKTVAVAAYSEQEEDDVRYLAARDVGLHQPVHLDEVLLQLQA